ncbi:MAG: LPS assembly protein LptD [Rickettsiales bacterium]|jgi:LPS-assembly protein|nr:LPS assembly protein LptD [Rickettsiales bacterium]
MKFFKIILAALLLPSALCAVGIDMDAPKTITAPKIEYNVKSSEIKTTGKTEISNTSGQKVTLVDSYIGNKGADAAGQDIELWLGKNVHVTAASIKREDESAISKKAIFTACYGCDDYGNAWEISTSTIEHNMDDHMMKFYNPVFWAYGIPIFWFPFLEMPDPSIKRKSGILLPDFNSTNNMGTQFNLPVYIALSDTHDMTVTFSYLTAENPLFQLEHRLNASHSEFRTHGSFTHNRDGADRWHIFNDDVIELGEHVRTTIYLERSSDKTYLQKYGFYDDQPYLDSGAKVELFGETGYVIADAHIFQELRSNRRTQVSVPNGDVLPNIRGTYQTKPLFDETYLTLSADILGISGSGTASQRVIGESRLVSPWTLWGGNRLTASMSVRYDIYNFDDTEMIGGNIESGIKSRFLPSGYMEWSLPLIDVGNKWKQIIEPRVRLTVMRELDDSAYALNNDSAGALLSDATLFSNNRFSGLDQWENGTFADYGVRWATFDDTGHNAEVFLGQSYDFTERPDTDPNSGFHNGSSDYVGRIGYENNQWLALGTRFRFTEKNLSLRHMETAARFGSSRNFLSLGHMWAVQFIDAQTMGDDIHELTAGLNFYLTERFGVKFNAIYNITDEKFQRHTGGIFYNHPCYFLSLEYRRDNTQKEDYVGNTTFSFRFGMAINGVKQ